MISSLKSPLRVLAASLLVGGLSFASVASAEKIFVETKTGTKDQIETAFQGESESGVRPTIFPVEVELGENTTVSDVKARMEEKTAVPQEFQGLSFNDKPLEDDGKKLKDYGIKDQDKLQWTAP